MRSNITFFSFSTSYLPKVPDPILTVGRESDSNHFAFGIDGFLPQQQIASVQDFIAALQGKLHVGADKRTVLLQPLNQILQFVLTRIDPEIKLALVKKESYLSRLFSNESWESWMENKTALGKIVLSFADYLASTTNVEVFLRTLNAETICQANEEAASLLKPTVPRRLNKNPAVASSFWEKMWSILIATDKRITALLPFPQGVMGEEQPNCGKDIDCFTDSLIRATTTMYSHAMHLVEKGAITPEKGELYIQGLDPVTERFAEMHRSRMEESKNDKSYARAKELFDKYQADYNKKFLDREHHMKTFPPPEYFFDEDKHSPPDLFQTTSVITDETSQKKCVFTWQAIQGYMRWSIFKDEWINQLVAEGTYNYDKGKDKPTVPARESYPTSNFCK